MTRPLISIVSASFNSGEYIEKAIQSVFSQTYSDIEQIVVDGGSIDNTLEILKSYGEKINWISEKDKGIYDALNKGFKIAKGEVLSWLDTDNHYLVDDIIEKVMNEFVRDENLEMVVTNTKAIYPDRPEQLNQAPENPSFEMFLNKGNKFVPEGVFFKKSLFAMVGGFDIQYKLLADYDLWLKTLKLRPKIRKLEIISAAFVVRSNALLRKDPFLAWRETFLIGRKYGRLRFFLAPAWRRITGKK